MPSAQGSIGSIWANHAKQVSSVDGYVGRRIRELREQAGLSLEALGEPLRLSKVAVHRYETGTARISAGRLYEIAKILGVPVASFFPEGRA